MVFARDRRTVAPARTAHPDSHPAPGKRTLVEPLAEPVVQRQAAATPAAPAPGAATSASPLSQRATIQQLFGRGDPAGQPLSAPVRTRMESSFGTDFSDVRIHEGSHVSQLGAEAYAQGANVHFAPGNFDPASPKGLELLGHELAHVVQQRAGRVAVSAQARGGSINDDPGLEAEADHAGARAARGEPAGLPAGGGGTPGAAVVQGYFKIRHDAFDARGVDSRNAEQFRGQDKDQDEESPTHGSFLEISGHKGGKPQGRARRRDNDQPDLRVANTGELAMEETDLENRQAKVFFATPAIIADSNEKLRAAFSKFQLVPLTGRLTVPSRDGETTHSLDRVSIENHDRPEAEGTSGRWGSRTQTAEFCNEMAGDVAGFGDGVGVNVVPEGASPRTPQGTSDFVDLKLVKFIVERIQGNDVDGAIAATEEVKYTSLEQLRLIQDRVAKEWSETVKDSDRTEQQLARLNKYLARYGVNQFATAHVGEVYMTESLGAKQKRKDGSERVRDYSQPGKQYVRNPWGYHWGAVVAETGGDRITLENYVRGKDEDKRAKENEVELGDEGETRFFFQMYGSAEERNEDGEAEDQSWHATWKRLGFANPLSVAFKRSGFYAGPAEEAALRFYRSSTSDDDHRGADELRAATTAQQQADHLLQALAYALVMSEDKTADPQQLVAWQDAVGAARVQTETEESLAENRGLALHTEQRLEELARWHREAALRSGGNLDEHKNEPDLLLHAPDAPTEAVRLQWALAYALSHLDPARTAKKQRLARWKAAVAAAELRGFPANARTVAHVKEQLDKVTTK